MNLEMPRLASATTFRRLDQGSLLSCFDRTSHTFGGDAQLYADDVRISKMKGSEPVSVEEYGVERLIIEEFAHDLDILQKHCKRHLNLPRLSLRVTG